MLEEDQNGPPRITLELPTLNRLCQLPAIFDIALLEPYLVGESSPR